MRHMVPIVSLPRDGGQQTDRRGGDDWSGGAGFCCAGGTGRWDAEMGRMGGVWRFGAGGWGGGGIVCSGLRLRGGGKALGTWEGGRRGAGGSGLGDGGWERRGRGAWWSTWLFESAWLLDGVGVPRSAWGWRRGGCVSKLAERDGRSRASCRDL